MSFMGEINDIGVADLLYLLALRQQSGRLSVVANGDEVSLHIEHGKMVLVTSSNMALRLGRMLVRLEFLTYDRLREALRRQEARVTQYLAYSRLAIARIYDAFYQQEGKR